MESPLELLNSWSNRFANCPTSEPLYPISRKRIYVRQCLPFGGLCDDRPRDVRHSNWIETESGLIYLVDWDSVRLTDRMLDVAHILSHYIPDSNWRDWLKAIMATSTIKSI